MIKSVWIDNFKSLVNFDLELDKFTCLVGLNGAGKSTVLQAMDFLSQLMVGDLDEWLQVRQWDSADINSKLTSKLNVDFKVVVESKEFGEITWSGSVNRKTLSCTKERVEIGNIVYLSVEDGYYRLINIFENLGDQKNTRFAPYPIVFKHQGSILSQFKGSQTHPALDALKESIIGIRSLDLLSPELLRRRTKSSKGKLGLGGEKLSSFIHDAGKEVREHLKEDLSKIYNQLDSIDTKSLRSGWKQLEVTEKYGNQTLKTPARHMNDGMLRLLAVLAQLEIGESFLLFDEIENGINPEIIEYLIDHLIDSDHQIMITTHSPMILNYINDEVAKSAVVYLYKTSAGHTKSIKFFDIPSMANKLDFMGPGEVFADTELTCLYREAEVLRQTCG